MESILNKLFYSASSKTIQRIKQLINDPSKCCVVFHDEIFEATFTERKKIVSETTSGKILTPEPIEKWQNRCIKKVAKYYETHLSGKNIETIILRIQVEENKGKYDISLENYISKYHKDSEEISTLYDSLKQLHEIGLQEINDPDTKVEGEKSGEYKTHLSPDAVSAGIKSGIIYSGMISVSSYHTVEAYVRVSEEINKQLGGDIFIPSTLLRNRAVHGDLVAVSLLPRSKWKSALSATRLITGGEDEKELQKNNEDSTSVKPTGEVVGIIQRNWRLYSATIQKPDRADARRILAIPIDAKVPKVHELCLH